MMWIILLVIFVFTDLYIFLMLSYFMGLKKLIDKEGASFYKNKIENKFSVVIAARNEEKNIKYLLDDLLQQNYPISKYEIILVDDDSQDKTLKTAKEILKNSSVAFQILEASGGKKKALSIGLQHINNDIIVFTDADCRLQRNWLSTYNLGYQSTAQMMLAGPVIFPVQKQVWAQLFSLEFAGLVASGAAAIELKKPIMVNGANLSVRREAIETLGEKVYFAKEASGDDVFLMSEIRKHYGVDSIGFLSSANILVKTPPPKSLLKFINQRIRWTSKSKSYDDRYILSAAIIVLGYNLLLLLSPLIGLIYSPEFYLLYPVLLIIKVMADIPLLLIFLKKYGLIKLWFWILPMEIVYPFYVVFIGIFGHFLPYTWKNRSMRRD